MPLTNTQYDEIMRTYEKRQLDRQQLIDERKKELARLDPEFTKIDSRIARSSVATAKQLLSGDTSAQEHLHKKIQHLRQQRTDLLNEYGYPENYLQPAYTCPDCQDTGYINNQRCHCLKQASIDLVYTQSNLRNILQTENFSNFSFDYYSDSKDMIDPATQYTPLEAAQNAVAQCRNFIRSFEKPDDFQNLLIFGDTGIGKTFLYNCVAKELLDTGHSVIYFSAHQLFELLTDQQFGRTSQFSAADYRNIFDCDLLIIDDLGTEAINTMTTSQFFVCLNERILNHKSTLISTNLELTELATYYSERIFSRIFNNFTVLHLFGNDIRIQKKLNEN